MKARVPRSRVSHDRWLVSYADFITLMFAFFVVLYAFARADEQKQMQVSAAIRAAFRSMGAHMETARPALQDAVAAMPALRPVGEQVLSTAQVKDDLDRLRRDLARDFSNQIASKAISLEMGRDGLVISLREAGFFASGSAAPKPDSLPTLRQIAARLGATFYDMRVEGHTDNVPIHNAQFPSNWELSTARATNIARLFLEDRTISPDRISAAGYAEFHPVANNGSAEGRAENRRVDVVVMPRVSLSFAAPSDTKSAIPPPAPSQ